MDDNRTDPEITMSEASETAGAAVAADDGTDDDELRRERDELKDLLLRKSAEFENFRRRTERERQAVSEAAASDLLAELLPLVDDLERALKADAGTEGVDAYRRGVELIHRQLAETLRKRGVRAIEAVGADFDPHYHQAVAHEPAVGRRDGEVIEEFRRGYMLGERLQRPSMVKLANGEA
jgi:molecular chaperone GrpE